MKVIINYTVIIDDRIRRAIRYYYGGTGKATRKEVKVFYEQNGGTLDDDISYEYDHRIEGR